MQYKVPQNVDIEDKVIGPLSLRQFMILLVAVGIILILYFTLVGFLSILFWLLAFIVGGIAFAFAFVKYGDQKLEIFAFSAWKTIRNPRKRIWKKEEDLPQIVNKKIEQKDEDYALTPKKNLSEAKNDLETLAQLVDSGGYSKLNMKDRVASSETVMFDDPETKDIIGTYKNPDDKINKLIQSVETMPQKEPFISDVASISPTQDFNYPKVELCEDKSYEKL